MSNDRPPACLLHYQQTKTDRCSVIMTRQLVSHNTVPLQTWGQSSHLHKNLPEGSVVTSKVISISVARLTIRLI